MSSPLFSSSFSFKVEHQLNTLNPIHRQETGLATVDAAAVVVVVVVCSEMDGLSIAQPPQVMRHD
jgi:hypothetical protein